MYKKQIGAVLLLLVASLAQAQTPKTYASSELLQQVKRLDVLGSVLYIAAHPDDENTRLLAYLANEKLYRTGYLSLTRGDGGQNLIGDEQGVELGLIRTQELLAARRIDGAEQFFSRAYDFGFCKSADEALATWGHDKILSDVVWVIRKFRPDVIIARFPEDARAGHGHHAASGILAREAFDAAADPTKFPEQLSKGVTVWQAKRMLWNTFNFGSTNTQNENQFKLDAGAYNPLLGKSYGEIAALSRSQHKSQGFGVPAQRGAVVEYFETIRGDKPTSDLMDGVNTGWTRISSQQQAIHDALVEIIQAFSATDPTKSLKALVNLNNLVSQVPDTYWKLQKQKEIAALIEQCSGVFLEATANSQFAVQGDSLQITVVVNNRLGVPIDQLKATFNGTLLSLDSLKANTNRVKQLTTFVQRNQQPTQPYWLERPMEKGSFDVTDQQLIGCAENDPWSVMFSFVLEGELFTYLKPVRYKFTDPVKGEVYQPVVIVPPVTLSVSPALNLMNANRDEAATGFKKYRLFTDGKRLDTSIAAFKELAKFSKGARHSVVSSFQPYPIKTEWKTNHLVKIPILNEAGSIYKDIREIDYDHIPSIKYFKDAIQQMLTVDLKTVGKNIGYIVGAGDKVPAALTAMGYEVTMLKESDLASGHLQHFDAIVTGVRAYNTNDWMNNVYDVLMQYVQGGGTLLVQYNTSSQIGPVRAKIAPYPFNISRTRVTDETASVKFLLPSHPALNYPNKITDKDFEGWIQERSIYHADQIDSNYQRILSMKDPGEPEQDGSLIIANYGKGKFVYTGLVFFRELPAGVPGAYRLLANLLAPSPAATIQPVKLKKTPVKKPVVNPTELSNQRKQG